jgi:hypothetical protein
MLASYTGSDYQQLPGLSLTNNLLRGNEYGVRGDNSGSGTRALEDYVRTGYQFLHNVLASDSTPTAGGSYPATTQLPALAPFQGGFMSPATGNYRLNASSPYRGAATDGKDIGVDMDALERAINGYTASATPPTRPTNVQIIFQ